MTNSPSNSDKYLAACAAGRWVLCPSYIKSCKATGTFVDELEHEWTPTKAPGEPHDLVAAPRRWRLEIAEKRSTGAFADWRALIYAKAEAHTQLYYLLRAGGATILE